MAKLKNKSDINKKKRNFVFRSDDVPKRKNRVDLKANYKRFEDYFLVHFRHLDPDPPHWILYMNHRIKDDRMEKYGAYIVFISK